MEGHIKKEWGSVTSPGSFLYGLLNEKYRWNV